MAISSWEKLFRPKHRSPSYKYRYTMSPKEKRRYNQVIEREGILKLRRIDYPDEPTLDEIEALNEETPD